MAQKLDKKNIHQIAPVDGQVRAAEVNRFSIMSRDCMGAEKEIYGHLFRYLISLSED